MPKSKTGAAGAKALRERADEIRRRLAAAYPDVRTALRYETPLQLLVATILSAQCTDARVNEVTATLFAKYRTARDYADAAQEEFEEEIRPTGFFRNKAKLVRGCCRSLVDRHGGEVPRSMEELVALEGVGRKTAAVVLGNAFGMNEGIAVDTHVRRVAPRLGLTTEDDPAKVEVALMALVPREEWTVISNRLIEHGRRVCAARKPDCPSCVLADLCPSATV